jgi:hypothetical protein
MPCVYAAFIFESPSRLVRALVVLCCAPNPVPTSAQLFLRAAFMRAIGLRDSRGLRFRHPRMVCRTLKGLLGT